MNPEQITHVAPRAENVQSASIEACEASQQPTRRVLTATGLRYAFLIGIVLVLTSLTIVSLDTIRETEAMLDKLHAVLGAWPL